MIKKTLKHLLLVLLCKNCILTFFHLFFHKKTATACPNTCHFNCLTVIFGSFVGGKRLEVVIAFFRHRSSDLKFKLGIKQMYHWLKYFLSPNFCFYCYIFTTTLQFRLIIEFVLWVIKIRGCSQTMLTRVWLFLTKYPPPLTLSTL